jgi:protein translocase SecG subunit
MFLVSLATFLYGFLCLLIIPLILIQKGKGSMGLGNMGGTNQMLFGSSGGQDIFQKITWMFCGILLAGALLLSLAKAQYAGSTVRSFTIKKEVAAPIVSPALDSSMSESQEA